MFLHPCPKHLRQRRLLSTKPGSRREVDTSSESGTKKTRLLDGFHSLELISIQRRTGGRRLGYFYVYLVLDMHVNKRHL